MKFRGTVSVEFVGMAKNKTALIAALKANPPYQDVLIFGDSLLSIKTGKFAAATIK